MVPFAKATALGNDFILVENTSSIPSDFRSLATRVCDRHFGVGADGLILWTDARDDFDLRIFNSDGSEAECSGNGLRCAAAYLIESGRWSKDEIRFKTISGIYRLRRTGGAYEADMGTPALAPEQIPFVPPAASENVVNYPLRVGDQTVAITACATGNPHCSLFVDRLDPQVVRNLGPSLENHPAFPHRTNVEFIHVLSENEIEVEFWERGVGPTYASGTGSCAAAVASILNGKTGRNVTVRTKAGTLEVRWPEAGRILLTGTATVIAEGRYWGD